MDTKDRSTDILARTIYGEARGEYKRLEGGLAALVAIGNVVMNRVRAASWFGRDVVSVCLKPHQFGCWDARDPNYAVIQSVTMQDPVFQVCVHVAEGVITQTWPDLVRGSTHYHHGSIKPFWAEKTAVRAKIGVHLFYYVP